MIKVLEDKTVKQVRCINCDSLLEVSMRDLLEEDEEYDGCHYTNKYFYCPCCMEKNYI